MGRSETIFLLNCSLPSLQLAFEQDVYCQYISMGFRSRALELQGRVACEGVGVKREAVTLRSKL